MGSRISGHIRGNVVGYVALFFAMSLGTAYALDRNAVKSKHIGAGQVKTSDLGNAAVTNAKLAPGSVTGANVVDDSLKGADVDESSLDLPTPPTIPSSLPPSGTAAGDLAGDYPNPQIAGNAVGTNEVDGSLSGADIADTAGGEDNVNAAQLEGLDGLDYAGRDPQQIASGILGELDLFWSAYFANKNGSSHDLGNLRLIEAPNAATAGEIKICSDTAVAEPYVQYLNGTRSAPLSAPVVGSACDAAAFVDLGTDGDIMISGAGTLVWGISDTGSSGDIYRFLAFRAP